MKACYQGVPLPCSRNQAIGGGIKQDAGHTGVTLHGKWPRDTKKARGHGPVASCFCIICLVLLDALQQGELRHATHERGAIRL